MVSSLLFLLIAAADTRVLVTLESDLPGATARVDELSADLLLPVTLKLAVGVHDVVLEHASLPPLKSQLAVAAGAPQRFQLSMEDPEHAPIVRLIGTSADDDVAIDGRFLSTPIPEANTVTPGVHEILMRRRGEPTEKRVRLVLERGQTSVIDLGNAAPRRDAPPGLSVAPIIPQPQPAAKSSALATAGWIAIGAGAAGGMSFAYFGLESNADADRARDAQMSPDRSLATIEPHQDAAFRHATAANVSLAAGAVAIGTGIVLLMLAD